MSTKKRKERKPVFAVLGAGHGGLAMAGHLAILGFEARLWNRTRERVDSVPGPIFISPFEGEFL